MCGPSSAPRNSRNTTSGMGLFGMAAAMSGAASATRKMTRQRGERGDHGNPSGKRDTAASNGTNEWRMEQNRNLPAEQADRRGPGGSTGPTPRYLRASAGTRGRWGLELEPLEAVEDHLDARQEVPRVEDLVELLGRERALGVGLETRAVRWGRPRRSGCRPTPPWRCAARWRRPASRVMPVSTRASSTLLEKMRPRVRLRLCSHLRRVDLQAVEHPLASCRQHVVERDEAVGQGDALGAGVRDVALVPQRHVVKSPPARWP